MQEALLEEAGLAPASLFWSSKGCPCSQNRHAGAEDLFPHPFAFTLSPERVSSARWANFVFGWRATTTAPHRPVGFHKPTGPPTTSSGGGRLFDFIGFWVTAGPDISVSTAGAIEVMELSPRTRVARTYVPGG